jgi:ribosomal protein S27AE
LSEKTETPTEKHEEPHVHTDEVEKLKGEMAALKRQIAGYRMREIARNKKPAIEASTPPAPAEEAHAESAKPHYVGTWQQYCPDCGDKNPEFKDETICNPKKGGCGMHLGAAKDVEKLKACPNCGGQHAARI